METRGRGDPGIEIGKRTTRAVFVYSVECRANLTQGRATKVLCEQLLVLKDAVLPLLFAHSVIAVCKRVTEYMVSDCAGDARKKSA